MALKGKHGNKNVAIKRTSRMRKPEDMTLEEWQVALRREYGREQIFTFRNLGAEPVFSEFAVTNPKSGRTYRVAVRDRELGANYCSCPDFAVNALGTCKHIEWLLAKLERKRGGKRAFRDGFQPSYSEVYLEYGIRRRVRFRPGAGCPSELRKAARDYFDEEGCLRENAFREFERFVRQTSCQDHEVRVYADALEFVARLRDDETRRKEIARQFEERNASEIFDQLLKVKLYPYQRKGALFAAKAGRCLVADDMGLGKTVEAIAAVEILARTAGIERVLVVCPTALKHQWKQEVERFTERSALVVEGFTQERCARYGQEAFYKITNYDTVHRDIEFIHGWRPDVAILDEAQRIKNWETRRAQCVKRIDTTYAIVLTGTPLENRLAELHSIMEFVDKFHLGPLFRFLHEHQHMDDHGRVIGYKQLDRIKESLAPVLVRRRKQEVLLELPERTDKHLFVDMTEAQRTIHEENRDVVVKIVAKWRRRGFLSEQDQRRLMVALQYMRMSCNSTYLVDKTTEHGPKIGECAALLEDILEVPEIKVVVFSQWLGTHELLLRRLNGTTPMCAFYHGSLDTKARKSVIERFKADPDCRILLCTDSGGVGLNLQVASSLINMDQPWNPAVLEQRIGRIHRLGQHRSVQVYHFISRDTIEHGMLDVLKFKSAMFEGVLDGGETEIFLGGSKMKKFMETVEQVSGAIPAHVPVQEEMTDIAEQQPGEAEAGDETEQPRGGPAAGGKTPLPASPPTAPPRTWDNLLSAGIELLGKFTQGMKAQADAKAPAPALQDLVARDERTGMPQLRVPLPDAETARKLGDFLAGLSDVMRAFAERR
jgi:superfamily II DNA or RNA helicase/predicted nucleic acid-binding Zn finger protein